MKGEEGREGGERRKAANVEEEGGRCRRRGKENVVREDRKMLKKRRGKRWPLSKERKRGELIKVRSRKGQKMRY